MPRVAAAGRRAGVGAAVALLGLVGPARAQVDREASTVAALVDRCDLVVVARVTAREPGHLELATERTLQGPARPSWRLPRGDGAGHGTDDPLPPAEGARWALFLALDAGGAPRPLASALEAIALPDDAAADAVARAVLRARPRLAPTASAPGTLGAPGAPAGDDALAGAFAQLEAPLARLRDDAALELLARRALAATPGDRARLRAALARGPSAPLLRLAARLPGPDLAEPVAAALEASAADPLAYRAAAAALAAIDPARARALLLPALDAQDPAVAARAAWALAATGDPAAASALAAALGRGDEAARARARTEIARALAAWPAGPDAAPAGVEAAWPALEALAAGPDGPAARRALAVLAATGGGAALRRLEAGAPDPARRALAARLRADPLAATPLLEAPAPPP